MIKNLWKSTTICCDNCDEKNIEMVLQPKGKDYIYKCPKCKNYITVKEFERIINKISKMVFEAEMNNEIANFSGYKWTDKGLKVLIKEHNDTKFIILVKNRDDLIG